MEFITDKGIRGKERKEGEYVLRQQQIWREKLSILLKSLRNCAIFIRTHTANFENIPRTTLTLRSVALQVNMCLFKVN